VDFYRNSEPSLLDFSIQHHAEHAVSTLPTSVARGFERTEQALNDERIREKDRADRATIELVGQIAFRTHLSIGWPFWTVHFLVE